jgi:hypothetical protein
MKVVRLSALHTGRLYPLWNTPCTYFCWGAESTPGPECGRKDYVWGDFTSCCPPISTAARPKFQWYQTRDFPACSEVPQRIAAPERVQDKNVLPHIISLTSVK